MTRTVLIDCGVTFTKTALQHYKKHGIRKIDALFLTHSHNDSIGGLDQLRAWTLHDALQKSVDVYLDKATMLVCEKRFGWLFENGKSSQSSLLIATGLSNAYTKRWTI